MNIIMTPAERAAAHEAIKEWQPEHCHDDGSVSLPAGFDCEFLETDWIQWNGGDCPVDPRIGVDFELRGQPGVARYQIAGELDWTHAGHLSDIVRYRVPDGSRAGTQSPKAGTKPSNPKDAIGTSKLDMGLVPDTAVAYMALALTEGALKYGRYNWRVAGVRASIYRAAAARHLAKWWNGEDRDPATCVPHLASVMACCAILIDAETLGQLTDDRPPRHPQISKVIEGFSREIAAMRELFGDEQPHQYTIEDSK